MARLESLDHVLFDRSGHGLRQKLTHSQVLNRRLKPEVHNIEALERHIGRTLHQAVAFEDNLEPRMLRLGSNVTHHRRTIWNERAT
jgi:hypothetical protein